jgi:hypothetical protein
MAVGQGAAGMHSQGYREQDLLVSNGHEDTTDYPSVFDTLEVVRKVNTCDDD